MKDYLKFTGDEDLFDGTSLLPNEMSESEGVGHVLKNSDEFRQTSNFPKQKLSEMEFIKKHQFFTEEKTKNGI